MQKLILEFCFPPPPPALPPPSYIHASRAPLLLFLLLYCTYRTRWAFAIIPASDPTPVRWLFVAISIADGHVATFRKTPLRLSIISGSVSEMKSTRKEMIKYKIVFLGAPIIIIIPGPAKKMIIDINLSLGSFTHFFSLAK